MQIINIFLGSSFRLMDFRKKLGDTVRVLNDKWLPKGVQVHLFKWEDFQPEYRGKSKQEEYIDEMVLKSEICMFLFSDSIGKFTKRELDAKLAQDPDAVHVYRVKAKIPRNKKKNPKEYDYDDIKNELDELCGFCQDLEDETATANELTRLVEEYIEKNNWINEDTSTTHDWYFYTTIPDDNAGLRNEFGDVFRHLDNFFYELQGIRCILHNREKVELLAMTDHYVPLMNNSLSDTDYQELETAVGIVNRQTERLKSLTFFKNGKIYPDELRVKNLLDKYEIFTVSYKGHDTLKSKMMEWILKENKKIVDSSAYVDTTTKSIQLSNKTATPFSDLDSDSSISKTADKANRIYEDIEKALKKDDILKVKALQSKYETVNKQVLRKLNNQLNCWAFHKPSVLDSDQKDIEIRINKLNTTLTTKLSKPMHQKEVYEVLTILQQIEVLTRELVCMGYALPQRLLAVQMNEVSIYDTYLTENKHPEAENALYKRIIDDADRFGQLEPTAEMMRMNYANSLSRTKQIEDAARYYKQAIANLQRVTNKSKIVWHNITDVYMHLCNLYADNGMHQELDAAYTAFKEHVMSLDFEEYALDYCIFAALDVKIAPKYETVHEDKVYKAIRYFDFAQQELNLPTYHQNYMDVFVVLPNWISAFFVDHREDFPTKEHRKHYLDNAEKYALISLNNAEKLIKVDYAMGLFCIGEALHQLGFTAANSRASHKALDYYNQALYSRKKLLKITGVHDWEPRIAQTLVNKGALLLESSPSIPAKEHINILNKALECAITAKEIYMRHVIPGIEMTECNYYETLQLEGTIYYALWKISNGSLMFNKSIECLSECWKWNILHPQNHYQDIFEIYSGRILRKHGVIE